MNSSESSDHQLESPSEQLSPQSPVAGSFPPPTTERHDSPTANGRTPVAVLVVLVGAAAACLGSILPWASILAFTVNGFDGDGKFTLLFAGAAVALVVAALRISGRQFLLASLTSVCLAAASAIFVYDSVRITRVADGKGSAVFADLVRPGAGLVIGVLGASVAFVVSLTLVAHTRGGNAVRRASAMWGPKEVAVLATSTCAVSLLALVQWWVVAIVLGVLATGLWVVLNRPRLSSRSVTWFGAVAAVAAIGGGIAIGATRDSSDKAGLESLSSLLNNETTGGSGSGPFESFPLGDTIAPEPSCDSIFRDGAPTDDVRETDTCQGAYGLTFVFTDSTSCTDGSTLYSNQFGWGYGGKSWSTPAGGVQPVGRCSGLDADLCTEAFAPGRITKESWQSGLPTCIAEDGSQSMVLTYELPCFNSNKVYLQNSFGWGYLNEPWQSGEPPSDC